MTRPDSGSPDQSANQDDAVWLDLVARLEGKSPGAGKDDPREDDQGQPAEPESSGGPGKGVDPDTAPGSAADKPGRSAGFRDFDPLGLAGRAPLELSAAERSEAAHGAPGNGQARAGEEDGAGYATQESRASGPRDYGVQDDGGDFVPEEPPSLAGTDPLTMLAWLGALGAPVALLLSVMFWRSAPLLAILGMVAAFLLSVVYLIMKLPQEKDENDDGARV